MVIQTKMWERSILSRGRTGPESCCLPLSTTAVLLFLLAVHRSSSVSVMLLYSRPAKSNTSSMLKTSLLFFSFVFEGKLTLMKGIIHCYIFGHTRTFNFKFIERFCQFISKKTGSNRSKRPDEIYIRFKQCYFIDAKFKDALSSMNPLLC